MCYNGTFRFKKLDDSFWNGETFRFADYTQPGHLHKKEKSKAGTLRCCANLALLSFMS